MAIRIAVLYHESEETTSRVIVDDCYSMPLSIKGSPLLLGWKWPSPVVAVAKRSGSRLPMPGVEPQAYSSAKALLSALVLLCPLVMDWASLSVWAYLLAWV